MNIYYASRTLFGHPIKIRDAYWKCLPRSIAFSKLNYNKFWFKIDERIYNHNSPSFIKEFNKIRVWELLQ